MYVLKNLFKKVGTLLSPEIIINTISSLIVKAIGNPLSTVAVGGLVIGAGAAGAATAAAGAAGAAVATAAGAAAAATASGALTYKGIVLSSILTTAFLTGPLRSVYEFINFFKKLCRIPSKIWLINTLSVLIVLDMLDKKIDEENASSDQERIRIINDFISKIRRTPTSFTNVTCRFNSLDDL